MLAPQPQARPGRRAFPTRSGGPQAQLAGPPTDDTIGVGAHAAGRLARILDAAIAIWRSYRTRPMAVSENKEKEERGAECCWKAE